MQREFLCLEHMACRAGIPPPFAGLLPSPCPTHVVCRMLGQGRHGGIICTLCMGRGVWACRLPPSQVSLPCVTGQSMWWGGHCLALSCQVLCPTHMASRVSGQINCGVSLHCLHGQRVGVCQVFLPHAHGLLAREPSASPLSHPQLSASSIWCRGRVAFGYIWSFHRNGMALKLLKPQEGKGNVNCLLWFFISTSIEFKKLVI